MYVCMYIWRKTIFNNNKYMKFVFKNPCKNKLKGVFFRYAICSNEMGFNNIAFIFENSTKLSQRFLNIFKRTPITFNPNSPHQTA